MRDELVQILVENIETGREIVDSASAIVMWQRIFAKFSRLLSPNMVEILFTRSLAENRGAFQWLPAAGPGSACVDLVGELEKSLSARPVTEVAVVTRALLGSFIDSLYALIGTALTAQAICSLASERPP